MGLVAIAVAGACLPTHVGCLFGGLMIRLIRDDGSSIGKCMIDCIETEWVLLF